MSDPGQGAAAEPSGQSVLSSPHDLLRIDGLALGARPDWVGAVSWVVVRREAPRGGRIAIGVRGRNRAQRWGGWMAPEAVRERLRPEDLLGREPLRSLPALALLAPVAALLARLGWVGGPGGSVGFELASGEPVVTPRSDFDLILRAPRPRSREEAARLAAALAGLGGRIDALMEVPAGAVALAEYARGDGPVALRTAHGPRLVANPWEENE